MSKYAIRSMLCASPGYTLLAYDLSQAEAWVTAFLANCKAMKESLTFKGPKDYHSTSARALFDIPEDVNPTYDQRYLGKKFNHSGNYGTSPMMIAFMVNAESINPPFITLTVAQAKKLHDRWKEKYYEIPTWWDSIQQELQRTRQLKTPYGRQRDFLGQWGDGLFKEAYAYIPQSTVADHMFGAVQKELGIRGGIREIYRNLVPKGIRILNTAHDSVIVETPNGTESDINGQIVNYLKRPILINGEQFTIPVDAEIGQRWGELEKYDSAA